MLLLIVLGFTGVVLADSTPAIISFQGQLRENGIPVSGNKTMHFKILNESLATVWESDPVNTNQVTVAISNGIYTVKLGDTTLSNMAALPASSLDKNQKLSLRVRVGTEDLSPDILLSAVPFAYIAKQAETITQNITAGNSVVLALRQATQNVGIGNTNPTNLFQVSSNFLVVSSNGLIGIGTTAPSHSLHIVNGKLQISHTGTSGAVILNRTDGKYMAMRAGTAGGFFSYEDTGYFAITKESTSNLVIGAGNLANATFVSDVSGNIGIGTISPTNLFHVSINAFVVSSNGKVGIANASPANLLQVSSNFLNITSTGLVGIGNVTATNLFQVSTNYIVVTANGSVGIGNASPTNLFQVSSNSLAVSVNGFVGIGDNSPLLGLDVDGGLAIQDSGTIVDITADNQAVTIGNRSYLRLSSNNGTNTNRSFTISNGLRSGQILILEWTHATNEGELQDAGNVRLVNAWPANNNQLNDTLTLIFNGTNWVEISRSAN